MENYWWVPVAMVPAAMVLAFLLALYWDRDLNRHNKALRDVMDMDIGEGVTLAQGLDAYYGGSGEWDTFDQWDMIRVKAGMRGPRAMLRIFPKTGEMMIWSGNSWDDLTEREIFFSKLVKAVKERKEDEERTGPDPVRRDVTYRLLNGFLEVEGSELSSDTMKLMFLTEQIYQYRLNLCERTGLDFEDETLEAIITTYEKMNRMCAEMMYDSGWHAGNRTYEVYAL